MEHILVTGGGGFIGGYVFRHLRRCGYSVVNYDMTGTEKPDDAFIKGSILDFDSVRSAIEEIDTVFHFAGFSNIDLVKANPLECIRLNIMGTANVLEAIRLKGKGQFIFASSVYVHDTKGHFYTTSKLSSELICKNYSDLYGVSATILRIGTAYGEKSRHEDVVSLFAKRACVGEPIIIHGSGAQKRHFIHGDDIAEACRLIIEKEIKNKTLVLAGERGTSVKELAEIVRKACPDVAIHQESDMGREDDYEGDISNLEETYRLLEWKPQVDLEEGVRRLIKYFRTQ